MAGKNIYQLIPLLIAAVCISSPSFSQHAEMQFNHVTHEAGLSHSSGNDILQDSQGYLWFGTNDGLNKYNGYEINVYRTNPADSTSLSGSHILTLFEDSRNNLWIGTSGMGLNVYNRDQDNFRQILSNHVYHEISISDNTVNAMLEDDDGRLWIGTSVGLNWYFPEHDQFIHFFSDTHFPDSTNIHSLSDNTINALAKESSGTIWVGTEHGLNRWNPEDGNYTRFFHNPTDPNSIAHNFIWDLFIDRNGTLWIGTKGGLSYYNADEDQFYTYRHDSNDPYSISDNSVTSILEDSQGVMWVGGENLGLNLFDRESGQFLHFNHEVNNPASLSNNSIKSLYESDDQILWIGLFSGGINYLDRKKSNFEHYKHQVFGSNQLSHNRVSSFLEDSHNNFWVGTDGGGLNRFDRENKTFDVIHHQPNNRDSPSSDVILALHEDQDQSIWMGYYRGGISRFDPQTDSYTHYRHSENEPNSLSNDDVFVLHGDRKHNLWVGTNGGGLNRFIPETETFEHYSAWQDIRSLHDDDEGFLWVGSYGSGLIRLNPETRDTVQYATHNSSIQSDVVLVIHPGEDEKLWLGTNGGLLSFDPNQDDFKQYTTGDGLPSMVINGIQEDDNGHLWLSTNNGITRFNPDDEEVRNIGIKDGLQGEEYVPMSHYKDRKGYLYFGGINGFNRFHPETLDFDANHYPVKITGFQLFNQPVEIGENSPLKKHISQAEEIILPHSASVLTFQFTALDFNHLKNSEFAYIMDGFDNDWNYVGSQRTATYTNLNPGTYHFRVKTANKYGAWNTDEASIFVTITPPFWKTYWFYLITFILIGTVVYFGFRYRMRKIRQINFHLEREIMERTLDLKKALKELKNTRDELVEKAHKAGMAEIAAGVLHNVGNVLNSVNTSTSLIQDTLKHSKIDSLIKANTILRENIDQIEEFISRDPKGKKLMEYYLVLEKPMKDEHEKVLQHTQRLSEKISLINEVVSAQQSYAGASLHTDHISLTDVIDNALSLQAGSIERHSLNVTKELKATDSILAQRSKLIHVLVNLFKNAKEAMEVNHPENKNLVIKTWQDSSKVYLSVTDNGPGIKRENLDKIFSHTFTTKKDGHGFGLHSSANYMTEMGGKIEVFSEGNGTTFTLTFPLPKMKKHFDINGNQITNN